MREFKTNRLPAVVAALLLLSTGVVFGQAQSGNLFGTVTDADGAELPGVSLTVSGSGAPAVQVTGADGGFRFLGLGPGTYTLTAALDGFSTVENPNISISVNRNTTVNVEMSAAIEETIVVTSESPLLDERKVQVGTTVSQTELESIPTSRDPWAILQTVPGVQTDRINVGGSESGQQSNFTGPGSSGDDGVWAVDGVVITDMAAIGSSPTYYNFDAFQEMQVSTGGSDVTAASGGVTMNMVTKRGTNEWRGSGRYLNADDSRQSNPGFSESDLGAGQAFFVGNAITKVEDYGIELGGPVIKDKLWIWANWGKQEVDLAIPQGPDPNNPGTARIGRDFTELDTYGAKINAQLTSSNSLVAFYNFGDKVKIGRNAGPSRPTATTWNQTGPTDLYKLENTHIFSSSFYLTGMVSYVGGGFALTPQGGLDGKNSVLNAAFTWENNYQHHETERPQEQAKIDGNYFFNSGSVNHELKFGVGYRVADLTSLSVWPGDVLRLDYYTSFGYNYNVAQVSRPRAADASTEYGSLYAQDTLTFGNLTANIGLRYDEQSGSINAVTAPGVAGFATNTDGSPLLGTATAAGRDQGFTWKSITPRLGLTYALGEDRSTLLRGSFSQFAEQLGQGFTQQLSTLGYSYAYFYYDDTNGDGRVTQNEIIDFENGPLFTNGYDPTGQKTYAGVDPGLDPSLTTELVLSVEHALLPELVVGATATLRERDDIIEAFRVVCLPGVDTCDLSNGIVRPHRVATASDFGPYNTTSSSGTLPDGTPYSFTAYRFTSGVADTGSTFLFNGDRGQNYQGLSAFINKRLSNRWMLRANFTVSDWEWDVPNGSVINPNRTLPGGTIDGGPVLEGSGTGSGAKGGVYISSTWSYSVTGLYQVAPDRPWGFNVAGAINGREGYALPNFRRLTGENLVGTVNVVAPPAVDTYRLDDVHVVDVRLEKDFTFNDFGFTVSAEVFNAFNDGTILQRQHRLSVANTNHVLESLSPRVIRLGLRLNFR